MNPGFEGLKIISAQKDGGREGVPVPIFRKYIAKKKKKEGKG